MSDILSIVKDQEKELKAQVPSFLSQTANSSPSKLLGDYEKTGNTIFKKAAGQALEFLSTAVQKAKEWTAPKAEALGAGVMFAGMAATPRGRRMIAEEVAPTVFKGFDDVSTAVLEKLSGRSRVSKQFIQDSLKQADIKQAEKNLIQPVLDEMGDVVDVNDFANRVKIEILPLERVTIPTTRYQYVNLPSYKKGWTNNYQEHIYESPIQTSAGDVHFRGGRMNSMMPNESGVKNYFAHTRTEDIGRPKLGSKGEYIIGTADGKIKTIKERIRNVLEVQSDLMQRGRLDSEKLQTLPFEGRIDELEKSGMRLTDAIKKAESERNSVIESKLEPYRNTWWNRIVRQEVKQAGDDGITKIRFPVGKTAMEIEGLGGRDSRWLDGDAGDFGMDPEDLPPLGFDSVKVGKVISQVDNNGEAQPWIVTDVLGDGKFKAMPKDKYERTRNSFSLPDSTFTETFDISANVDSKNPIYKFYEDDIGKFLKNKFNAKRIKDDKGVEWWEVDTGPFKGKPVLAHAASPILGGVGAEESMQDNEDRSMFGKAMAGAGLFAGAMATPRGRRMIAEEGVNFISNKLKNTWYGSADEIASVLSKPRMYTPDEQLSLFVEHIQPKLEKLKTPRDDQVVVFYQPADGVGGQYVNTRLEEVFHYPVDENLKVKVVPLSKLKSTGDDAKDSIGYRILDNSSSVEPIRGERGLFKGSKSLKNPIEYKLSILKKMDGIDARLGVKILETLDKTYDGSNNLIAAKMLQTYFKSDPKFYSEIVKRTSQSGTPMLGTKDPVVAFIAEQLDMLYGEGK